MDRLSRLLKGAGVAARPLVLTGFLVITGCGGGSSASPAKLVDGSSPRSVPVALRNLARPMVMTRVRVVRAREFDHLLLRSCLGQHEPATLAAGERVVERIGVAAESLTFRGRPAGWIRGCDSSAGPVESGGHWCSGPIGRLRPDGRLYDPRLDIGCLDAKGHQIGSVWIDTLGRTRYLTVDDPGYTEVYETAGGLPVRVTTSDVSIEGSSATFLVTQYAADGSRLSHETVRTAVAG
jgi:hypothetical protein